ncbi:globin domain-containing protein [Phreatobacter stygius]|uniref:Hemin receptor n=1 Tax=Phreatobacter stygius TaxID=1940610 RepID=A0A4D7BA11_9HYPH|nr:globin domain-containing protein [Phreatobacter stygius]QCI64902.1 hemin receptor [Phreatobacter stygius]
MTPKQVALIRRQFGTVAARKDEFAAAFYEALFHSDPTLRPMFPADMRPQRAKLVVALAHVILSLDDLSAVLEDVRALGLKHVGYGVVPDHYNAVGEALLAALAEMLGDAFDDASQAAWALAYGTIADVMIEAAADKIYLEAAE